MNTPLHEGVQPEKYSARQKDAGFPGPYSSASNEQKILKGKKAIGKLAVVSVRLSRPTHEVVWKTSSAFGSPTLFGLQMLKSLAVLGSKNTQSTRRGQTR